MKVKITKTTTEEIDIDFPVYRKYCGNQVKITSPDSYTDVSNDYILPMTGAPKTASGCLYNGKPSTEQEFNEAYDSALRILFQNRPYGKVNLAQSFDDFKNTLSVSIPKGPEDFNLVGYGNDMIPTNGRHDPMLTWHSSKEINEFIP